MYLHSILWLAGAVLTEGSPTPRHLDHVVHERHDVTPRGWTRRNAVHPEAVIPLRIGLKQRNLDLAHEMLESVSHPDSPAYGRHFTQQQIVDMFAPSEESISSVTEWLSESGIAPSRIEVASTKLWVNVNTTISEAESLLRTKYHFYEHETGFQHPACESYSVPRHLSVDHIDLIMPTLHFDVNMRRRGQDTEESVEMPRDEGSSKATIWTGPSSSFEPVSDATINRTFVDKELALCYNFTTMDCLREMYQFPYGSTAHHSNTLGVVELSPAAYVSSDLDSFFSKFAPDMVGERPILASVDGGYEQNKTQDNGESDLDLSITMALVYPQTVTLFQVGDGVDSSSFNNFLDAIDSSYCSFEGGDDPAVDGIYPDTKPGGYNRKANCGTYTAPNVVSVSYSYDEVALTRAYAERQCKEYLKLGLQGVTLLYSSGDFGVAGNSGKCVGSDGQPNDGKSGAFIPLFPGGCPYVTSVGATQVKPGVVVKQAIASGTQPEKACETGILSGGGFSNYFEMPEYQRDAVKSYLSNHKPPYNASQYNNSGVARGYPDVSANGANYIMVVDGNATLLFGTSASAPTFASVITLINEKRLAADKAPVGFINPALYAHSDVMNDVTEGGNAGCGTAGFTAASGWDPVTGLGTPNYPKMLQLFMSLP